jgi:hypothetical protein
MTILPLESGTLNRPYLQSRPADDPRMNRVLFLLGLSVLINYLDPLWSGWRHQSGVHRGCD